MTIFVGAMMLGAVPAFLAYPNFKVEPSKYRSGLAGVTANLSAKVVVIDKEFPTRSSARYLSTTKPLCFAPAMVGCQAEKLNSLSLSVDLRPWHLFNTLPGLRGFKRAWPLGMPPCCGNSNT